MNPVKMIRKLWDEGKRETCLICVIRPILFISCVAGIMPVGVYQTADGKYNVKLLQSAYLYSVIFRCLTFAITIISTILTYRWFGDSSYFIYLTTRLGLITLAQISFIRRRQSLVQTLKNHQSLGVSPPFSNIFVLIPIVVYLAIVITSIITHSLVNTGVNFVIAVYVFVSPPIVYIFPSAMYSMQMAILAVAVVNLNKELKRIVNITSASSFTSELRFIMKQHVLLRSICSEANETFGMTVLLTNAAVFVEVIYYFFVASVASSPVVIVLSLGWAVINLSPTIFVMLVGQHVENAFKETMIISSETKLQMEIASSDVSQMLREWRVQMKQLPLRFTADGYFDLSRAQTKNILATVIIYTIILVQTTARPIALKYFQQAL